MKNNKLFTVTEYYQAVEEACQNIKVFQIWEKLEFDNTIIIIKGSIGGLIAEINGSPKGYCRKSNLLTNNNSTMIYFSTNNKKIKGLLEKIHRNNRLNTLGI